MDPGEGGSPAAPSTSVAAPGADADTREDAGKQVVVILVGPPGSGKSTFAEAVMAGAAAAGRPWARVCQDTIGKGKAGTKIQCLKAAAVALKEGKSVLIDRCNLEREQRSDFVKLGCTVQADVHAVFLDLPAKVCISRSVSRTSHEGNVQGGMAAMVVNRMLKNKQAPLLTEGFSRITFCTDDDDIKKAVDMYSALGPSHSLASGVFGQKSKGPVQTGIMKFLKKADTSSVNKSSGTMVTSSERKTGQQNTTLKQENLEAGGACSMQVEKKLDNLKEKGEQSKERVSSDTSLCTLAFPSISTADFQFDLEKASEVIVDAATDFVQKHDNVRLVLVDLSQKSRILSLVKDKAAKKSFDSSRFFTFVGDITQLHSKGGLQCNVIANAANWRLKPGGGGVNAAIFNAAGEALQHATKECADTLRPGNSVAVPLPSTSPLHQQEGVTHVIHVLGPNMNPMRPDCLKNDYTKGCNVLREAYNSVFENFASIARSYPGKQNDETSSRKSASGVISPNDSKTKREGIDDSERTKKCKLLPSILTSSQHHERKGTNTLSYHDNSMGSSDAPNQAREEDNKKNGGVTNKTWGSWAQSLYEVAMHPEKYKNADSILEISDEFVVLKDLYPKAKRHVLVISRTDGLDSLADVKKVHLPLLRSLHSAGLKWAHKFLEEDASLTFRLGYHSVPSMRQLHLHVISQDFNSPSLKNKKHWNSFTSAFFLDSVDVMDDVDQHGSATINPDEKLLAMELRCHRCRSAHPNIPKLKSHIGACKSPFPSHLLKKDKLLSVSTGRTGCS
ncbi:transcription factor bHLH140-like [Triticum dicoccoides]|uniref:transcription factor bHLH140-like n=1 Tax=Triticum dicoccoides TaxID=85692 RepID=UPI000E78E268|nr:transcription factor bHLH140-like [Triticum dicoccoides]